MAKRIIDEHTEHWGRAWQEHLKEVFLHPGSGKYALLPYSVMDGKTVAAVFVLRLEVEAMVLYFLSVGSAYQGMGIGSKVIDFAAKRGKKMGAKFLRLDTYAKFGKALAFYKKMGFRVCGRVRYFNEDDDEQIFLYKKIK